MPIVTTRPARYGIAFGATSLSLLVTRGLEPWLEGTVLPPTLAAVVVVATFAGRGPGLFAALYGALGIKFLFLPDVHTVLSASASSLVRLGLFVGLALPLAHLAASRRAAADALQKAVLARDQMLAIVSHDLRGPLSTILLTASSLSQVAAVQKQASRIQRSATKMDRLVRDLLDHASIEAGTLTVVPAPCAVSSLLAESFEAAEPLALEKDVVLSTCEPTDATASCDRQRVLQVIGNLVGNALKFTPAEGRIDLVFKNADREVHIGVRDTGCGIKAEHVPHVFERHWQARAGHLQGTGLGLTISKGIVEAHGGRIWVESKQGVGTTVWFSLPRAPHA